MTHRTHRDGACPRKGYTLIELLVSMAIFAIVMLAATAAFLSFIAYNRQAQATASVMNSLSFAIDSMAREIRSGTDYAVAGNVITFTNSDGCQVTYQLASGAITRSLTDQGLCATVETSGPVTDTPTVTVKNFKLTARGTLHTDKVQPIVTITINGSATVPNTNKTLVIPFQIETSATQRLPDLPTS